MKPPKDPPRDFCTKTKCFLAGCATLFCIQSFAQTVSTNTGTATATVTYQVSSSSGLAIADEPFGLHEGLVHGLRSGGYVLYVRHGAVLPATLDQRGPGTWWQDCTKTQRLAPEAQPRARAIGEALQRLRIPIQEMLTSEFCRAYDTGIHLGTIAPVRTPALNDPGTFSDTPELARHLAGIQELLSRATAVKANRVLIGHTLPANAIHPALSFLQEGQTAIFKAEGNNRFHFVTMLTPGQWQWIGKQNIPPQGAGSGAPASPATAAAVATAPVQTPATAPLIDPAREIKGIALVESLRRGGFNLYMRHAQATVGQDGNLSQTPAWWENCAIQRNMSDLGREQARKVGTAIRNLKIPIDQVLTAQFCRTQETGHELGLGAIEVTEDINHQIGQRAGFDVNAARFKRLAGAPAKGMNNVLVSHTHASSRAEERIMSGIMEAEIVVFKPDGKGNAEPVARIPIPEWENLARLVANTKP